AWVIVIASLMARILARARRAASISLVSMFSQRVYRGAFGVYGWRRGDVGRRPFRRLGPAWRAAALPAAGAGGVRGRPRGGAAVDAHRGATRIGQDGGRARDRAPAGVPSAGTRADGDDPAAVERQAGAVHRFARVVLRRIGASARADLPGGLP